VNVLNDYSDNGKIDNSTKKIIPIIMIFLSLLKQLVDKFDKFGQIVRAILVNFHQVFKKCSKIFIY